MRSSTFIFRQRYSLHLVLYVLGFWAPWNLLLPLDSRGANAHIWGILAADLAQAGIGSLVTAFNLLLSLAIVLAFAGAALRTWGTAYLGIGVVKSGTMQSASRDAGDGILRDGPFAHLRNPLYLGTFLHTLALALLMPRSGAILTLLAIWLLQLYLILGEETFLAEKLGAPYLAYCARVPRLWPSLKPRVPPQGSHPRWGQAFAGEIYFWGVALSLAVVGWQYNAQHLLQCVMVCVGASIIVRAFLPKA
jgi:protein-S-isoprenylcysteine O-methyltransferase Ste14